jgi:hypothetical protein
MNDTTENFWEAFANWEEPILIEPTYRLYHDENGNPLFYSMEAVEGNYIDIDKETYTASPSNVRIVDGKLRYTNTGATIRKLVPSTTGTACHPTNVLIIVDDNTPNTKWTLKTYE